MREPTLAEANAISEQKPTAVKGDKKLYHLKGEFSSLLALRLCKMSGHKVEWTVPDIADGALVGIFFRTQLELHADLVEQT